MKTIITIFLILLLTTFTLALRTVQEGEESELWIFDGIKNVYSKYEPEDPHLVRFKDGNIYCTCKCDQPKEVKDESPSTDAPDATR